MNKEHVCAACKGWIPQTFFMACIWCDSKFCGDCYDTHSYDCPSREMKIEEMDADAYPFLEEGP